MKKVHLSSESRKTLGAIGVLLLMVGIGIMVASHTGVDSYSFTAAALKSTSSMFPAGDPMPYAEPVRLRIPDLYIDTNFVPLGLQDNGEIEVPEGYEEVGWYTYGATPGELGPAVVLGHVDSYKGPGVFLALGQLQPGDYVHVDRDDGTTATFRVTQLERYDRDAFPSEKVYGAIDHAGLRLVTCSGTFDKQSQEYDRVLVVYAVLVDDAAEQ